MVAVQFFILKCGISSNMLELRTELGVTAGCLNCYGLKMRWEILVRAVYDSVSDSEVNGFDNEVDIVKTESGNSVIKSQKAASRLQETITSLPPVVVLMRRSSGATFVIGFSILATLLVIIVQVHVARKSAYNRPGSVVDLVRRGQLRSDRRSISSPPKYEDPFNNLLIRVGKSNSTLRCVERYTL